MNILKRVLLFCVTAVAAACGLAAAYALSLAFPNINAVIMNMLFFTLPAAFAIAAAAVFDLISPLSNRRTDSVYRTCVLIACAIAVLGMASVAAGGQYLYKTISGKSSARIVMLIDSSSSMDDGRLEKATAAAEEVISVGGENDEFAVVAFDTQYEDLTFGEFIGVKEESDKNRLIDAVDNIIAGGGTDVTQPLEYTLETYFKDEKNGGIFVISDAEDSFDANDMAEKCGEITVNALLINETGESEFEALEYLTQLTGGSFVAADDNADYSELYTQMFHEYKLKAENRLYAPRSISLNGAGNIYLFIIQIIFYLLPGVVMAAAYTVLFNRRDFKVWYCAIGGAIAMILAILNCLLLQSHLFNLGVFVLMYPALITAADYNPDQMNTFMGGTSNEYLIR